VEHAERTVELDWIVRAFGPIGHRPITLGSGATAQKLPPTYLAYAAPT
jgi:hypothetical protein